MDREEYYKDYPIFIINSLRSLIHNISQNGIYEEAGAWLIKYGVYNLEAVEYLKEHKMFSEELFEILDEVAALMDRYEESCEIVMATEDTQKLQELVDKFFSIVPPSVEEE